MPPYQIATTKSETAKTLTHPIPPPSALAELSDPPPVSEGLLVPSLAVAVEPPAGDEKPAVLSKGATLPVSIGIALADGLGPLVSGGGLIR